MISGVGVVLYAEGCKGWQPSIPYHKASPHLQQPVRAISTSQSMSGQVTKVGRGQKLGDNAEAVPFSDMTVEDLLRIVRSLPPEESAVAAVSRGLFYLDSRALAALLKELHKVGLSNRCVLDAGRGLLHLFTLAQTSQQLSIGSSRAQALPEKLSTCIALCRSLTLLAGKFTDYGPLPAWLSP